MGYVASSTNLLCWLPIPKVCNHSMSMATLRAGVVVGVMTYCCLLRKFILSGAIFKVKVELWLYLSPVGVVALLVKCLPVVSRDAALL